MMMIVWLWAVGAPARKNQRELSEDVSCHSGAFNGLVMMALGRHDAPPHQQHARIGADRMSTTASDTTHLHTVISTWASTGAFTARLAVAACMRPVPGKISPDQHRKAGDVRRTAIQVAPKIKEIYYCHF